MSAFVYMLRCADGSFYVGSATGDDLTKRIAEHQTGAYPGNTSTRRPVLLVWSEHFSRITDAIAVERKLKGWSRAKKVAQCDWSEIEQLSKRRGGRPRSKMVRPDATGGGSILARVHADSKMVTQRASHSKLAQGDGVRTAESAPGHVVSREHFLDRVDQLAFLDRELRLRLLLQIVVTILAQPGDLGAENEILDLDLALLFLIAALDHDAGRTALVGVFHLRTKLAGAEIKLGANLFSRRILGVA